MRSAKFILAAFLLLIPVTASAQINSGPDKVSNWSVGAGIAADGVATFNCHDRARCAEMQAVRLFGTYVTSFLLKELIHSERPCTPYCHPYRYRDNMPSMHVAFAVSATGDSAYLGFTMPAAGVTAWMRHEARAHNVKAILWGGVVGGFWSVVTR